jgi:hypothetical protein
MQVGEHSCIHVAALLDVQIQSLDRLLHHCVAPAELPGLSDNHIAIPIQMTIRSLREPSLNVGAHGIQLRVELATTSQQSLLLQPARVISRPVRRATAAGRWHPTTQSVFDRRGKEDGPH